MGERDIGQVDWRAQAVTRLAADWTSPWTGITHAAGAPVKAITPGRDARRRPLSFVSPSPEALALSLSMKGREDARAARGRVAVRDDPSFGGTVVADEDLEALYDYFEACFVVVTFAHQALEAFANGAIRRANPKEGFEVSRRDGRMIVPSRDLERSLSLDEKLGGLLPRLLAIPSPSGKRPWPGYRKIKAERDALLHLKSDDASPRSWDKPSIFHRLWVDGVEGLPDAAIAMIDWFGGSEKPRWVTALRSATATNRPNERGHANKASR